MDEAFMPLHEILGQMLSFTGRLTDEEECVVSTIYECTIESPLEMDVFSGEDGAVSLGSTPPLYNVNTSFMPSFHQIRFKAVAEESYGG